MRPGRGATADWREALADARARLDAARVWLEEGGDPPAPFVAPSGLGPLPAHLVEEARGLLAEHAVLEAALELRRAELGSRHSSLSEALARPRPHPGPRFLDAPC